MLSNSEKIRKKIFISKYLEMLSKIVGKPVFEKDIGSIADAKRIRAHSQVFEGMYSQKIELNFSIHEADRIKNIFSYLRAVNISSVYLWVENSIDCGLLKIDSLADVNVEYLLGSTDWEIMGLLSEDMKDYLLLEINEYSDGLKFGLDVKGANWSAIDFSSIL
ncbi:hypothetical protein AVKW3434_01075 [Acidovorax sp. SUPP3434]|uniref:hypothetical protein n=1 Tax=Acidovorax sp. SUPP3434 TaxID=2920880 RepID=UPI0023DE4DBA|nr:hypothetical protein [Acidovorax sp. SUPP3434]GKS97925.1 hypothetical protein AVKW3434_01075 [Acidovorax sp. SUPP3434]